MTIRDSARVLIAFSLLSAFPSQNRAADITFHHSIDAARKSSDGKQPLVLLFGAEWCGWCRKMEADTLSDPRVAALADRYRWVKIDIDEQRGMAARFRARGVPVTILLGPDDQVIASRPGYLPPEKFVEFLTADHSKPSPVRDPREPRRRMLLEDFDAPDPDDLMDELAEGRTESVRNVVELLSRADRSRRRRLLASVAQAGRAPWPVLFELMHDDRLATRAAAASALDHATHAGLPFHPFAAENRRAEQIAAWKVWLEERGVTASPPPAIAEIPEQDDATRASEGAAEAELPK